MLMFYDIICEICMPNSDTIFQSHVLDMFKIFLFLVVYLIPVVCSSRALLVTRIVFECLMDTDPTADQNFEKNFEKLIDSQET